MFNIIQTAITHKLTLIDFTIFTKFQENILPDKYSITVFMNHNESIKEGKVLDNKMFSYVQLGYRLTIL